MNRYISQIVNHFKSGRSASDSVKSTIREKFGSVHQNLNTTIVERIEEIVSPAKGLVTVKYRDGDGPWRIHCQQRPNLLVNTSRKMMTHLIARNEVDHRIQWFQIGTKGYDTDITIPVAPTISDDQLVAGTPPPAGTPNSPEEIFEKEIFELPATIGTSFVFDGNPPSNESAVRFLIPLDSSEANGSGGTVAWTEAGLFANNGLMFSRITFPAIVKISGRTIVFEWILIF